MSKRRICRLSSSEHKNVDLRLYKDIIIDTINQVVPRKNPKVESSYFSTDELTQSEAIKVGRALARIEELAVYGKEVTTFRLFEGHLQDVKENEGQKDKE